MIDFVKTKSGLESFCLQREAAFKKATADEIRWEGSLFPIREQADGHGPESSEHGLVCWTDTGLGSTRLSGALQFLRYSHIFH